MIDFPLDHLLVLVRSWSFILIAAIWVNIGIFSAIDMWKERNVEKFYWSDFLSVLVAFIGGLGLLFYAIGDYANNV